MSSKKILTICLSLIFIVSIFTLAFSFLANAETANTLDTKIFLDSNEKYVEIGTPISVTENTNENDAETFKNIYVADSEKNKIFVLYENLTFKDEITIDRTPKKISFYSDSIFILCSDNLLYKLNLDSKILESAKLTKESIDLNKNIVDFCVMNNTLAIATKNDIHQFDLTNNNWKKTITETQGEILSVTLANTPNDKTNPISVYYSIKKDEEIKIKLNGDTITSINPSPLTINIVFNNNKLYLIKQDEVTVFEKDTTSDNKFTEIENSGTDHEKLYAELGIASIDALYVTEEYSLILNIAAHAVIKFDTQFNYLNSYASGLEVLGKFNKPKQIIEKDKILYILDNKRIQTIDENNNVKITNLSTFKNENPINTNNIKTFTVTKDNKIYIIESDKVHIIDEAINLTPIQNQDASLSDIATTLDNKVFLLDISNEQIATIENTNITHFLSTPNAKKIAANQKDKKIYVLTDTSIEAYSTETKTKLFGISHNLTNVIDFDVDFTGNIYILSQDGSDFVTTRIDAESQTTTFKKVINNKTIKPTNLNSISINNTNGQLMFTDLDCHKIFYAEKSNTSVITKTDTPNLKLPINVTNKTYNQSVQIGVVKAFPSTLFYPPHKDTNFDPNYANNGLITLEENKEVLILGEQKDFYYVLVDGNAGFIYKNEVEIKKVDKPFTPFKAKIRDANTAIFSIPSSKSLNHENAYQIQENSERISLKADTDIMVMDNLNGYIDNNGISYYLISINGKNAYINSHSIYKATNASSDNFKMARVSTGINTGETPIYSVMDIKSTPIAMLKDNAMVKVYFKENGFAYISTTDEEGKTINGYIKDEMLVYNGLTTSQIIVLSVIGGIVVLFITSLILIKVIGKRKKI